MPTYDYECGACGHALEIFQGINDPVLKKCPECGKSKLARQFGTGAAIVFKGSGFYQTDYRSDSYKKAAKADTTSTESSGDSAKSSGESKPKTEKKPDSGGGNVKKSSSSDS